MNEEVKNNDCIISEGYKLPSEGLIYEKPFNPHVELRSMTVKEEMKRLSPTNTPYKKMSDMIEACLLTKLPMHVYDLCVGDYEYLLHKLRVVSYGSGYKTGVYCPNCGKQFDTTLDLDSLEVKEFNLDEFNNLLKVHLKKSNKDVVLKYQTPRILDDIELRIADMKKRAPDSNVDFGLIATLEFAIDTVDGTKLSFTDKNNFISRLEVADMKLLLDRLNKINKKVGLETDNLAFTCPHCGYEVLTFFRYQQEFFSPTIDD